jgi:ABC-type branched-subunit amino acid transport system substrate-binding protein
MEKGGEALPLLERFVAEYPKETVTDEALSALASVYARNKDCARAALVYERLLRDFPESSYRAEALYGAGLCKFLLGERESARNYLSAAIASASGGLALKAKVRVLLESVAFEYAKTTNPSLALLVPLSGDSRNMGEAALKGALLAAGVFDGAEEGVEIVVKDSAEIEKAVEELVEMKDIRGIAGPFSGADVAAVTEFLKERPIPAISFSQREDERTHRILPSPGQLAQRVAEYAVAAMGAKKIAVLYPENPYGEALSEAFKKSATGNGALIVASVGYTPGRMDFGEIIQKIFGVASREYMDGRRHRMEFTPTIKIDALYIPDGYTAAAQIASHLAYYNIKDVRLLGANAWNSHKLVEAGGRYVEGALFADGFFSGSKRPETVRFVKRFLALYGYEPGVVEAHAFDAVTALIAAIKKGGLSFPMEGATGSTAFLPGGGLKRGVFLLKVENGNIVEVEEGAAP